MKEFKTCEEYVIDRVIKLESEKAEAEQTIAELQAKVAEKNEIIEMVKERLRLREYESTIYIDFDSVWARHDTVYDKFIKRLGLENDEAEMLKDIHKKTMNNTEEM